MPPRNKRNKVCPTCPTVPATVPAKKIDTPVSIIISSETEAIRIWSTVQATTALSVGLMEGYVQMGLPGMSHDAIVALIGRLNALLDE